MADAVARFHLSLSEDMAGAAAAAGQLDAMRVAMQADIKELNSLKAAMRDMQKAGKGSGDVFDSMRASAKSLELRIGTNQERFAKLGGSYTAPAAGLKKVAEAAAGGGANIEELTATAKGALGPMGGMFEKATLLSKGLGKGGFTGIILALSLATIAFAAAVWSGVFALAAFAVTTNKDAMGRLEKSAKKARDVLTSLFKGVRVEAFVKSFESLVDTFDESSSSAQALKSLLGTLLNPLFDSTTSFVPIIKVALKGVVAGLLYVTIAALRIRNAFRGIVPASVVSNATLLKVVFWSVVVVTVILTATALVLAAAGTALAIVLGAVLVAAAIGFALLLVMIAALVAVLAVACAVLVVMGLLVLSVAIIGVVLVLGLLAAALILVAAIVLWPIVAIALLIVYWDEVKAAVLGFADAAVSALYGFLAAVWSTISGAGSALLGMGAAAIEAAGSVISGLVGGISSGAGAVVDAVKRLASGAMDAFKAAIGFGSPAKAFIAYGDIGIAGGIEQGVEQGSARAQGAVEDLVSVPAADMAAPTKADKSTGGSVVVQLNYSGSQADEPRTRDLLSQLCDAIELGCKQQGIALSVSVA